MNTHAKKGKKTSEVERVITAYHRGQNIFRRESVSPLIKYIGELEARLTLVAPDAAWPPDHKDEPFCECSVCMGFTAKPAAPVS